MHLRTAYWPIFTGGVGPSVAGDNGNALGKSLAHDLASGVIAAVSLQLGSQGKYIPRYFLFISIKEL